MKKQLIFPVVLLAAFAALPELMNAQISVGIRGGLSINNLKVDPLQDGEPEPESVTGFQIAIPMEIAIGEMFAIQPEVIYATHGARQELSSTSNEGGFISTTNYKAEINISALEIPVLAKAKFGSENLKFHVLAGPSFGLGLSGKGNVEGSARVTDPLGNVLFDESLDSESTAKFTGNDYDAADVDDDEFAVSRTNLNLHVGAGLSFKIGAPSLFVEGRYMLGLSDLSPEAKDTNKDDAVTTKSNRIGINVGLMFPLN
jgi:hypothetical protein